MELPKGINMKRLKITGRIIYNFILWIAICSCLFNQDPVNKKTKTKNNDQNLKNNHSTFVYNMIPDDPAAKISIAYSKAVNAFAVKLLDKVYNSKQFMDNNVILSPFSIGRNLAVITEGTAGESKQEILNCLGGQAALDDAQAALSELLYADNSVVLATITLMLSTVV